MKFVCNNCGFSAEVPDNRSNCPMCASNNVSVSVLTESCSSTEKKSGEQKNIDTPASMDAVHPVVSQKTETVQGSEKKRKEKITLSDTFFDPKPNKDDQEIANILKELYPESGENKSNFKMPGIKVISVVLLAVAAVIALFVFLPGKNKVVKEKSVSDTAQPVVEEEQQEVVKETTPEEKEKTIVKEEKVVQKPVEQPVKKEEVVKPVEQKKQEKVKVVQVKKTTTASKKTITKPSTIKEESGDSFNAFVQAGHKSLSEKRYTDALHEYKNASRLNPSNGSIYKFLGIAYAYLQNQEQACVNYKKYIQLSPNAPDKAQVEAFIQACP